MALVTENRLNNVISKMGRIEHKDTEKVLKLLNNYMEDVMEQLKDDQGELLKKLAPEDELKMKLRKDLKVGAKRVIRTYFQKRLAMEKQQNANK